MSEWECPINDKWTEPVREQAIYYIAKIYSQGYKDALEEITKESKTDV